MRWDIFCKVIDNHGDLGVCWRLATQLGAAGDPARLWVDDGSALAWMAPHGAPGVEVRPWSAAGRDTVPGDVVVEAFGCELDSGFVEAIATRTRNGAAPAWINLEYLSAESWVERCHGLPSPVQVGPARGLTKHFFYPGFTAGTGGLLREADLMERQAAFDRDRWLAQLGVRSEGERLASLFCYEPPGLAAALRQLAQAPEPTRLLVTFGRARAAVEAWLATNDAGRLRAHWLPPLPHPDFDHLLWACDLNFVRGEDSLVRALWAGRPFVWNIYPQSDGAHVGKLDAFLDWLDAPDSLRRFHHGWNEGGEPPAPDLPAWGAAALAARERALGRPDLATQLRQFAATRRGGAGPQTG